jgi:hypothetical protein
MKRRSGACVLCLAVLICTAATFADEGMWTFDNPPLKQWKERYQFTPDPCGSRRSG